MHRQTRLIMGMPVSIATPDEHAVPFFAEIFDFFGKVDARFSPFRQDSEVSRLDRGVVRLHEISRDMRSVLTIAADTEARSNGYFSIRRPDGRLDPSGIVKGWAIREAAERFRNLGNRDFFIDAGGDVQTAGTDPDEGEWRVGLRNPFNDHEIVKVIGLAGQAVATSGNYARGAHIYDPKEPGNPLDGLVSISVIADDILEADRFATAAFAMGRDGIGFIEAMPGFEAYAVDGDGIATMTSGFEAFERS